MAKVSDGTSSTTSSKHLLDPQTKKILRYLDDTSKRLDDYTGRCNNVFELFSTSGAPLILRSRLGDLVWKALRLQESGYDIANKALELGWRKMYYEPIHVARRLKKRSPWSNVDAGYIESHLTNGIGHYHSIIAFICDQSATKNDKEYQRTEESLNDVFSSQLSLQTMSVSNYGFDDCAHNSSRSKHKVGVAMSMNSQSGCHPHEKWKRDALHRCFTSLGDLSRYRIEFEELQGDRGNKDSANAVATMYYNDALLLDPNNGMPFNQLAALASSQNFGLDSLYYYLRCLTCTIPFKGCEPNLQGLFQKNTNQINKLETRYSEEDSFDSISQKEECERSVIYLLRLVQELMFEESTKRLAQYCQKALQHVQKCLYMPYTKVKNEDGDEIEERSILSNVNQSLSSDIACKMVIVLLLVMSRLKSELQETKLSMIRAYLLALFSHFITKLLGDAYFCIFGPESMTDLFLNETDSIKEIEQGKEETDPNYSENCFQGEAVLDEKENLEINEEKSAKLEAENSRKKPKKKKFHDVIRRKRRSVSNSDVSSNVSYSSHESIASTSNDSDEDSDKHIGYLRNKRRPLRRQDSESEASKGKQIDF